MNKQTKAKKSMGEAVTESYVMDLEGVGKPEIRSHNRPKGFKK